MAHLKYLILKAEKGSYYMESSHYSEYIRWGCESLNKMRDPKEHHLAECLLDRDSRYGYWQALADKTKYAFENPEDRCRHEQGRDCTAHRHTNRCCAVLPNGYPKWETVQYAGGSYLNAVYVKRVPDETKGKSSRITASAVLSEQNPFVQDYMARVAGSPALLVAGGNDLTYLGEDNEYSLVRLDMERRVIIGLVDKANGSASVLYEGFASKVPDNLKPSATKFSIDPSDVIFDALTAGFVKPSPKKTK